MFKRILVAVVGSPTANHGLAAAVTLAKEQNATLHVLHVVDDAAIVMNFDGVVAMLEYVNSVFENLRERGRRILARAEATASKAACSVQPVLAETRGSSVAQAILFDAGKLHADLIVLGTHGRRGVDRLLMGSDAEAVARQAMVPVLLVRSPKVAAGERVPRSRKPILRRRCARTPAHAPATQ